MLLLEARTRKEDEESLHARKLSRRDEEKVAQSFTSSFPRFVRIMKRFNISGSYTLKIPFEFCMKHLPNCKTKVVLRNLKGEYWIVNSVPSTKVQTAHTFCGGWMAFVRDNDIKMRDICIFELVHKCEMLVHIVGDGKEGPNCQSVKAASDGLTSGSGVSSQKTFNGLPKKLKEKSSKSHSESSTNLQISVGRSVEYQPGSKARVCMSMMSALKEEKAAESFTSSFPIFVRIMKKFNISGSYTLNVPHQFSTAHLPNCKTEVVLGNLKGECWTVNSVPALKGRAMHTFCGGWMAFVRGNNIKLGDICFFELVGELEMRVHISRAEENGVDNWEKLPFSSFITKRKKVLPVRSSMGNGFL